LTIRSRAGTATRRNNRRIKTMLKGIPPILSPELLKVLDEMGHTDELTIGDGNFPGHTYGKRDPACPACQCAPASMALLEKVRTGSRIQKRYHPPLTPLHQLLGKTSQDISLGAVTRRTISL
jgi:hypothetical protein